MTIKIFRDESSGNNGAAPELNFLFGLWFYIPFNSYGHVEMVSLPRPTFLGGKLALVVNQYSVHILLPRSNSGPLDQAIGLVTNYATGPLFVGILHLYMFSQLQNPGRRFDK